MRYSTATVKQQQVPQIQYLSAKQFKVPCFQQGNKQKQVYSIYKQQYSYKQNNIVKNLHSQADENQQQTSIAQYWNNILNKSITDKTESDQLLEQQIVQEYEQPSQEPLVEFQTKQLDHKLSLQSNKVEIVQQDKESEIVNEIPSNTLTQNELSNNQQIVQEFQHSQQHLNSNTQSKQNQNTNQPGVTADSQLAAQLQEGQEILNNIQQAQITSESEQINQAQLGQELNSEQAQVLQGSQYISDLQQIQKLQDNTQADQNIAQTYFGAEQQVDSPSIIDQAYQHAVEEQDIQDKEQKQKQNQVPFTKAQKKQDFKPQYSNKEDQVKFDQLSKKVRESLQGASVYIVGLMGSGKSTVGNILAQTLKYRFIDTDMFIEQAVQGSISDIFQDFGEEKFRDIEQEVIKQLASRGQMVIACGGGAVIRPDNWNYMRQGGIVIWLDGAVDTLTNRIVEKSNEFQKRPLLQKKEQEQQSSQETENTIYLGAKNTPEDNQEIKRRGLEKVNIEIQEDMLDRSEDEVSEEYSQVSQKLRQLLLDREHLYQMSDFTVNLDLQRKTGYQAPHLKKNPQFQNDGLIKFGANPQTVLLRLLDAIDDGIRQFDEYQSNRKNFKINRLNNFK